MPDDASAIRKPAALTERVRFALESGDLDAIRDLQKTIGDIHSPWLDMHEKMRSMTGFSWPDSEGIAIRSRRKATICFSYFLAWAR